jgi:hypothetical protein
LQRLQARQHRPEGERRDDGDADDGPDPRKRA